MTIKPQQPRNLPNFDSLAKHYHWLERISYGPMLHRCRVAFLHQMQSARRILILGDGDGRFLSDLIQVNRSAQIDSLDGSRAMINLARQRLGRHPAESTRIRLIHADARTWNYPRGNYDCVVTNFFLDCFPETELQSLIGQIAESIDSQGSWFVGDFRLPDSGWKRPIGQCILHGMYGFFRWATGIPAWRLIDPAPLLLQNRFELQSVKLQLGGFLASSHWVKLGEK